MRVIVLGLFVLMIACTKDVEYPHNFPLLITDEVDSISTGGARFNGHVLNSIDEVTSYGFEWTSEDKPQFNGRLELQGKPASKEFSVTLRNGLGPTSYKVKAFVKTTDVTVNGTIVMFTSLGSNLPTITGVSPASGFDGETVTLTLKDFIYVSNNATVSLGDNICPIVSWSDKELKIVIPPNGFLGDVPLTLRTAFGTTKSLVNFKVLGPSIKSISKTSARVGDIITISAENLDKANAASIVFGDISSGTYTAGKILSSTQIEVQVPDVLVTNAAIHLVASVAGQVTKTSVVDGQTFSTTDAWNSLSATTPLGTANNYYSAVIDNMIYVVGDNRLYQFNPASKAWQKKSDFPGTARRGAFAVAHQGKLYYGFGITTNSDFSDVWVYDPGNDTWQFLTNSPIGGRYPVAVSSGDNIYIGLGVANDQAGTYFHDLWKYDPATQQWTAVTAPLSSADGYIFSAFVINGDAYFYGSQGTLWKFNFASAQWKQMKSKGLANRGQPFISIGSTAVAFASVQSSLNGVFEYDPVADVWTQRQTFKGTGRAGEIAAFVNGTIYFGLGGSATDFWEFSSRD